MWAPNARAYLHRRQIYTSSRVQDSRWSSHARVRAQAWAMAKGPNIPKTVPILQVLQCTGIERKLPCKGQVPSAIQGRTPEHAVIWEILKILQCTGLEKELACDDQRVKHSFRKDNSTNLRCTGMEMVVLQGPQVQAYLHQKQIYYQNSNSSYDCTFRVNIRLREVGLAVAKGPSITDGRCPEYILSNER